MREKGANGQKDIGQTTRSGDGWRGRTKAIVAPIWSRRHGSREYGDEAH